MRTFYCLLLTGAISSARCATSASAAMASDSFTRITAGDIVQQPGTGLGCAWGDFDKDGFIDLIITQAFNKPRNAPQQNLLFRNNRDGTFEPVTNTVVTSSARDWRGCSWVDYDNDGYLDLFVTSTDYLGPRAQNELFRNNGDGTFTKMTRSSVGAIVAGDSFSEGAVWADYDGDGFLDLFLATTRGYHWLYRNDGNGIYSAVNSPVSGAGKGNSYFAAWGDYNNDVRPDLFVAVKMEAPSNLLYLNQGGGRFEPITNGSVVTDKADSFGCGWGDYDNDGDLDLFVANGGYVANQRSALYRNNGDLTFTPMTNDVVGSIVSDSGGFIGCHWGDYDNDGFLDLFVACFSGTNVLYHNQGSGSFARIVTGSLVNDSGFFGSCIWGDYDNDGFLDLFVSRGGINYTPDTNLLYHNNGNNNGWVKIKLEGSVSNRSAIGAKARLRANIAGKAIWQMREINTGDGFGAGPLEAHFGLGDATSIETLRIEWPSGTVQEFQGVPPRKIHTIIEPSRLLASIVDGTPRLALKAGRFVRYEIERSSDLTAWSPLSSLVVTNADGTAEFQDTNTVSAGRNFYRAYSGSARTLTGRPDALRKEK